MNNNAITATTFQMWIKENLSPSAVEERLHGIGVEHNSVPEYVREFKKQKRANRMLTGFILMGVGGFIGFISCVLTLINPLPDMHDIFLYGGTSMAIIIAFIGLYFVIE